jgi:DNA-binding HxlR family transcriptional regulator
MRWTDIDQQLCSVARALSVVGERWTLLILRDAFLGTRRFEQFQHNLGITRHRLSERLSKLVEQGVLVKVPYCDHPPRHEYRLTRKGLGLYPVLMSLARWGDDWMPGAGAAGRKGLVHPGPDRPLPARELQPVGAQSPRDRPRSGLPQQVRWV